MDRLNEIFLNVIKCALRGEKLEGCEQVTLDQWQRLFAMAKIHSVLPMFYEAVYDLPVFKGENGEFLLVVKRQVVHQVMMQTMKTSEFLKLNQKLQDEGLKPLVVKGIVCRNLYKMPDHRPSGDEDMLVSDDEFRKCHEVFEAFGMETETAEEKLDGVYEVTYSQKNSPLYIELHKRLFSPKSEAYGYLNDFFEGVHERAVAVEIGGSCGDGDGSVEAGSQGHMVWTLEYTDNLFYMICHALKHFIHSGFGIRQVCDILMFAEKYGDMIDWTQVLRNCRAINADKFAAAMFKIGEKHLGFDLDQMWKAIDVDETDMLNDLLDGGLYGDKNMSRKHSSNITLGAVESQHRGKKKSHSVVSALFPSRETIEEKYPYVKKYGFLLPVAWGQRIVKYAGERPARKDNNAAASLKIGRDRVQLMKQYGIIK